MAILFLSEWPTPGPQCWISACPVFSKGGKPCLWCTTLRIGHCRYFPLSVAAVFPKCFRWWTVPKSQQKTTSTPTRENFLTHEWPFSRNFKEQVVFFLALVQKLWTSFFRLPSKVLAIWRFLARVPSSIFHRSTGKILWIFVLSGSLFTYIGLSPEKFEELDTAEFVWLVAVDKSTF